MPASTSSTRKGHIRLRSTTSQSSVCGEPSWRARTGSFVISSRIEYDRWQALTRRPRNDLIDEGTSDTATAVRRHHRQLVEVALAVDHPRQCEPDDRFPIVECDPASLVVARPL